MKESRKIFLLNANDSHAKLYFEWVNSASSLSNKLETKKAISKNQHYNWFTERILDPNTYLWVIKLSQGDIIGQVRFQLDAKGYYDVDIFILPVHRMQGYALLALMQAMQYMKKCKLRARVKDSNKSSK